MNTVLPEMKILLIADINSGHTEKWVKGISLSGFEVALFSRTTARTDWYQALENVSVHPMNNAGKQAGTSFRRSVGKLRDLITEFQPDIVHAHYASSNGLLGALSGFHPLVISVWGSDVYEFPRKSFLHKVIIRFNFRKADRILSTSNVMVKEIAKYTTKPVDVTPFGIDLEVFRPTEVKSLFAPGDLVIGTVKSLEKKYGIDYLIDAFAIIKKKMPDKPLKLLIVGDGSRRHELEGLSRSLGVSADIIFTGRVAQEDVVNYQNMISIFCSLSVEDSESFGVSAVEAAACEKPVVVSDVDGFCEVVADEVTGIIVPRKNALAAADAIMRLLVNPSKAREMGLRGRERVIANYDWRLNLQKMIDIYNSLKKK